MKDIDFKKEGARETFDYSSMWGDEEEKRIEKELEEISESKGAPRKGIKGKYIKPIGHVSKKKINYSYARGIKKLKEEGEG